MVFGIKTLFFSTVFRIDCRLRVFLFPRSFFLLRLHTFLPSRPVLQRYSRVTRRRLSLFLYLMFSLSPLRPFASRSPPPLRGSRPASCCGVKLTEKMVINLYKLRNVVYLRCCSAGHVPAQRLRSGRRKAESHTHILALYARHTGA